MTNDSTGQFTVTVILTRPTSYLLCWMSLKTFQNYRNTTHHPELILSLSPDNYSSPRPLTCLKSQSVESDGKQITKISSHIWRRKDSSDASQIKKGWEPPD